MHCVDVRNADVRQWRPTGDIKIDAAAGMPRCTIRVVPCLYHELR